MESNLKIKKICLDKGVHFKATPHHIRKSGNLGIVCPTKINKKTALPQKTNKQIGERLKETPLPSQNYSDPTLYSNSTIIH